MTSESFIDRFYHRNPKIDPLLAGKICLQLSNSKDIKGQQQHKQLKLLFYIYIIAGDTESIEIIIYQDGNWEFLIDE